MAFPPREHSTGNLGRMLRQKGAQPIKPLQTAASQIRSALATEPEPADRRKLQTALANVEAVLAKNKSEQS